MSLGEAFGEDNLNFGGEKLGPVRFEETVRGERLVATKIRTADKRAIQK
jgi:hypothetical protein